MTFLAHKLRFIPIGTLCHSLFNMDAWCASVHLFSLELDRKEIPNSNLLTKLFKNNNKNEIITPAFFLHNVSNYTTR